MSSYQSPLRGRNRDSSEQFWQMGASRCRNPHLDGFRYPDESCCCTAESVTWTVGRDTASCGPSLSSSPFGECGVFSLSEIDQRYVPTPLYGLIACEMNMVN